MANRARSLLSSLAPRSAARALRAAWVLAGVRGQSRTDARGFCLDADGRPIPWLTHPAIDYLAALDFSDASVFEYGCGASTLWWARRAARVAGVEMDAAWITRLRTELPPGVEIAHCADGGRYPDAIAEHHTQFDVIVVDGAERHRSAEQALRFLSERGLVILDNSDWYPNTARLLRAGGLRQIDFVGFGPLCGRPWATSLFVRPGCAFLARHADAPVRVPGGATVPGGVLDDGPARA